MTKEKDFEYPENGGDSAKNEFLEREIEKELDKDIFDQFEKPKGSFGALAAAEKRLKYRKKN